MASSDQGVAIIGSGAAGHSCAQTLRSEGFPGTIRLINGEGGPAINRTLVDTGVLPGLLQGQQIALAPVRGVEMIDGRAMAWNGAERTVVLETGTVLGAEAIVIASGSAPRELEGIAIEPGVRRYVMHSVRDAERLRLAVPDPETASIVVLGAGFIGAEVASHYAAAGARVTLIGRSRLPLRAAVGDDIAARLAALHAEHVDARLGTGVLAVHAADALDGGNGVVVELDDGSVIEADALLVAVGSRPSSAWAGFDGAIYVDDRFRLPSRPGVYAAGSVAAPEVPGGRVDHWDAAVSQGAHAARAMLHDFGLGDDPGPWSARTGFILAAHGANIAFRGYRDAESRVTSVDVGAGGLLTEFTNQTGRLTGVAGWNAGPHLARAAMRL